MTVVFSTYQSIDVISKAQKQGYPEFDLIVADEAHRTTGASQMGDASVFTKVHDNGVVKGKLRLYQTATPKVYGPEAKKKLMITVWLSHQWTMRQSMEQKYSA